MDCPRGADLLEQPLTVVGDVRPRAFVDARTLHAVYSVLAVGVLGKPDRLALFVPLVGEEFTVAMLMRLYCTAGVAVEPLIPPSTGSTEVEGDGEFFCCVPVSPAAISHAW